MKTRIVAIFQIRKSIENPEISKIGRKKCSHVPMFPEIFQKTSPAGRWADRPRPMSPPAGRGSEHIGFGIRQSLLQILRKNPKGRGNLLRGQTMSREMIDSRKGFLLQHASEWSTGHRPFLSREMIDFTEGFLL